MLRAKTKRLVTRTLRTGLLASLRTEQGTLLVAFFEPCLNRSLRQDSDAVAAKKMMVVLISLLGVNVSFKEHLKHPKSPESLKKQQKHDQHRMDQKQI